MSANTINLHILIRWNCVNNHLNSIRYDYEPYFGSVREVVFGFCTDPTFIDDNPCTICRESGFHNVQWEWEQPRGTSMDVD